jgi:hypothetical protein
MLGIIAPARHAVDCVNAALMRVMTSRIWQSARRSRRRKITRNDVAENLEGLPPVKMHCSNLAADALHGAIEDYLKKEGRGEWFDGTKKPTKKKTGAKKGARRRRAA